MSIMPNGLKRELQKIDPRVKPPEHEKVRFKEGSSRRYMNIGIVTRDFFRDTAEALKDQDLRDHAKQIEEAVYSRDGELFETYKRLFAVRMQELGAWKSVKGLGTVQKVKILSKVRKIGKIAKQSKDQEEFKKRMLKRKRGRK